MRGTDVEAFHLARRLIDGAEGHASGHFSVSRGDENGIVVARQRGELAVEILEREVDAQ
jgi:hypothetical protein